MSDLRERIARVLAVESVRQGQDCDWAVLSDAVIRELGLHPVETLDRRYVRWVTKWRNNPKWKADDE